MQPYNYTIQRPDLANSFMSGLQPILALQQLEQSRLKNEGVQNYKTALQGALQGENKKEALNTLVSQYPEYADTTNSLLMGIKNQEYGKAAKNAYDEFEKGNIEPFEKLNRDYGEYAKKTKAMFANLNSNKQRTEKNNMSDLFYLLSNNKKDEAINRLNTMIKGTPEGGDTSKYQNLITAIEKDPELVRKTTLFKLSQIMNKDEFENFNKTFQINKDLKMMRNPEVKLSSGSEKLMNDLVVKANDQNTLASQYTNLANEFKDLEAVVGMGGTIAEAFKNVAGLEDRVTLARQNYDFVKMKAVIDALPPGPATDTDITELKKGFPDSTANIKTLTSFMRGMAKVNSYSSAQAEAKAEWIGQVGNLGRSKTYINIMGQKIPKGTTFSKFTKEYMKMPDVFKEYDKTEKVLNEEEVKASGITFE